MAWGIVGQWCWSFGAFAIVDDCTRQFGHLFKLAGVLAFKLRVKDHACFRNEVICYWDSNSELWVYLLCCIPHSLTCFSSSVTSALPVLRWSSGDCPCPISVICLRRKVTLWMFFVWNNTSSASLVLARLLLSYQYGDWLSMIKLFRKHFSLIMLVSFVFCNNFESDYDHGNAL